MSRVNYDRSREESEDEDILQAGEDELYDPDADDDTERWVRENLVQRNSVGNRGGNYGGTGDEAAARGHEGRERPGDAVEGSTGENLGDREFQLTCPCCFTLLCVQCQQHVKYKGQFRAMFVMNCSVKEDEMLRVRVIEEDGGQTRGRGRRRHRQLTAAESADQYYPVACNLCGTDVGVLDGDGVYHFCNVMY